MRPPQFAGEKQESVQRHPQGAPASMRPPQFAGEKGREPVKSIWESPGFNEAPAVRGGKDTVTTDAAPVVTLLQ